MRLLSSTTIPKRREIPLSVCSGTEWDRLAIYMHKLSTKKKITHKSSVSNHNISHSEVLAKFTSSDVPESFYPKQVLGHLHLYMYIIPVALETMKHVYQPLFNLYTSFVMQELLAMIELDIVSHDMFDLPPLSEYELYVKKFGADDTRQVSIQ